MDRESAVVGKRIRMLRTERFIAQTELANRIGVSQTHMSNIEHGRTAITLNNLFKLREELGCRMRDFFVDFDGESKAGEEVSMADLQEAMKFLQMMKQNKQPQ